MFSNSNSYLGGANTGRAYGQQSFGSQQQPTNNFPGQQPGFGGGLQPQPTGFGGGGLQPQPTGFGGGGLQAQPTGYGGGLQPQQTGFAGGAQPQYTGYSGQQQQSQPQSQFSGYTGQQPSQLQPQATGYPSQQQQQSLQSQYTGFPTQNTSAFQQQQQPFQTGIQSSSPAPAPRQQPQPTGMTSSQIADSFRGSAPKPSTPQPTASNKIPKVRLSFITADDQSKFEQLFKSAVGSEQSLSGDQARDLLLRSKLPGDTLSQIWMLSDTTKSGRLLFPEFALSMYLCNIALVGKQLPARLPDSVTNEVSSMVDRISFNVPDDHASTTSNSNAPSFSNATTSAPQQPQPSSGQLLSQLMSQPTGYQQPAQSFQPQPTGFMPQQTGFMNSSQPTGYGSQAQLQPMATGFGGPASIAPLNAQPTGRPGTWGLVNAPASGLPNMQALQSQMMPQQGREGGFTSTGLRGNATVPWAVTKDEKKIYDNLFKAWDGFGKGFITGNQAIEIFGQSGLDKPDLERIWTLSDPSNRGRLDLDEFAVAMHLIYRKLNGYPVPARLPPELIPPSTRNLNASLTGIKSLLSRDAEERKSSGAFLEPQKTGVSYLKNHSFSGASGNASGTRKDATVYRNNDDDVGYKSTARRRIGADGRSQSPDTASPPPELSEDLSLDQLRKKVREKQVILDAIDFQDENQASQDDALDRKDKKDADELFRRIRNLQEDLDKHPNSAFRTTDSEAERRTLRRQLQGLTDKLPEIASQVRRAERAIADAQLELFRLKDAKANPTTASAVVGTGPGGAVTESDKLKARAKAMMQQRAAALSGKTIAADSSDTAGATRRMEEESARVRAEKDNNDRMVKDIEESVAMFSKGVEDGLKDGGKDEQSEHERRRWEDALGVEDEVKEFIFDLQRSSRSARVRREDNVRKPRDRETPKSETQAESPATTVDAPSRPSATTSGSSYASYKTAEERAAFIKQQAEARMAERLAALGLRPPPKAAETAQARQERERKEKDEKLRQAEAEDANREQERQRRLADEQITPPSASKKPPPPPVRNGRSNSVKQAEEQKMLAEEEKAQSAEVKQLEDEERRQEEELQREREASEARRKALEEQVKQGKIKKDEEKRRRQSAQRETKDKEDRLAAQRAELEAARAREQELQRQLEALGDDDSSDEDGPARLTPSDTTGTASQELVRDATSEPPTAPPAPPALSPAAPVSGSLPTTGPSADSKNPFFRKMQSNTEQASTPSGSAPSDTNPFHRMTTAQSAATPQPAPTAERTASSPAPTRASRLTSKAEDDDWSVVNSEDSSDDDDPASQPTGAGNARNLASILFGSMGPPRTMSGMSSAPASPAPVSSPHAPPPMPGSFEPAAPSPMQPPATARDEFNFGGPPPPAPPPPPPMMPGGAAPAPPPGPPPMPSSAGPPPPPMPGNAAPPPPPMPSAGGGMPMPMGRGGLLGEIQAGKGLRKVQTKDKSTASTAGRVL